MANSQTNEIKEIEDQFDDLQIIERNEIDSLNDGPSSGGQTSDLNTRLLHHLVEMFRVMKDKELLKANNELINELLSLTVGSTTEPTATKPAETKSEASESASELSKASWNEILAQKLIDAKLDPTDAKVKELVDRQLETALKRIDDVLDSLVFNDRSFLPRAASVACVEDKLVFELEQFSVSKKTNFRNVKCMYVRGLTFEVYLANYLPLLDLSIDCKEVPANKACKAGIEVKIKDKAGQSHSVRSFSQVFCHSVSGFRVHTGFAKGYLNESLGFLSDGKVAFELVIRLDELVEHHSNGCSHPLESVQTASKKRRSLK